MGLEVDASQLIHQAPTIAILLVCLYFARDNFNKFKEHVYGKLEAIKDNEHALDKRVTILEENKTTATEFVSAIVHESKQQET